MKEIQAITDARGARYGDFTDHARTTQGIKAEIELALKENVLFKRLDIDKQNVVREGLEMIAHKIGRIVNGDPAYDDSWLDIEGYSKITRERVCEQGENK